MKENFDWAGILGKPCYSLQNKFNFFCQCGHFHPSYGRFLSKNR